MIRKRLISTKFDCFSDVIKDSVVTLTSQRLNKGSKGRLLPWRQQGDQCRDDVTYRNPTHHVTSPYLGETSQPVIIIPFELFCIPSIAWQMVP